MSMSLLWRTLKTYKVWIVLGLALCYIARAWTVGGYETLFINTDIGRDLKEISNIQAGRVVWLGPWIGPGLHVSSIYYYLFYPAIVLAGGKISGMISFNLFLALIFLGMFGCLATRKHGYKGAIMTLFLGLTPFVSDHALHPGNGFTYLFFCIAALTSLWFELPLVVASLAAGMAIALHPAAGVLPLFLVYEWWRRGRSWKSGLLSLAALAAPLAPLFAFEVITKGYMTRSFLARPDTNYFSLGFSFANFKMIGQLLGMPFWVFILLFSIAVYTIIRLKESRLKIWLAITCFFIFISLFFDQLVGRYLFGIAAEVGFLLMLVSFEKKRLLIPMILFTGFLLFHSSLFNPKPPVIRHASQLERVADFVVEQNQLSKNQKIAVVAALTPKTEVPQADDYRFLLRNRGYQVVEVTENNLAEKMVIFVEVPNFDWQHWSTWETESFGPKKVDHIATESGVTTLFFSKQ
jgi:hypothetical protein